MPVLNNRPSLFKEESVLFLKETICFTTMLYILLLIKIQIKWKTLIKTPTILFI